MSVYVEIPINWQQTSQHEVRNIILNHVNALPIRFKLLNSGNGATVHNITTEEELVHFIVATSQIGFVISAFDPHFRVTYCYPNNSNHYHHH